MTGASSRPAEAPTREDIPQVAIMMRLVRMPMMRAATGFCWVAFMAIPRREYRKNRNRTLMATRATTKVRTSRVLTKKSPNMTLS